jgi:glycosyltransferase involved in cell wall biosynthesis
MNKMRIIILLQNLSVGGIQRLVVDEANALWERGHEVWVATFEPEMPGGSLREELRLPEDRVIFLPYSRMRSLRGFFTLVSTLNRLHPSAILTHHWFANTVGRLAARFVSGKPTVIAFEHSDYAAVNPARQLFFDRILQFGSRIVAVSDAVKTSLVRRGIEEKRITVIPNGLDLERYDRGRDRNSHLFRFVFIGRLISSKKVDVLIHALTRVSEASLILAGDGPERQRLETLAEDLGLASRVRFMGAVLDVSAVLAESDCLVLPSVREGFGLVILEALASGIPVIASDLPAFSGLLAHGENGLAIPPGDEGALAEGMRRMSTDRAFYAHVRDGAKKTPIGRFSIARHADALQALLVSRRV